MVILYSLKQRYFVHDVDARVGRKKMKRSHACCMRSHTVPGIQGVTAFGRGSGRAHAVTAGVNDDFSGHGK